MDKILINNKRLKEIRLYSCKGAAGGRVASISYILWKKTKADIYASEESVSFRKISIGKNRGKYVACYPKEFCKKHGLSFRLSDPVVRQTHKYTMSLR